MITTDKLKAMAGWAMSRIPSASDAQACALHRFKDGCHALIETPVEEPRVTVKPAKASGSVRKRPVVCPETSGSVRKVAVSRDQIPYVEDMHCQNTGQCRFDIRTQHCVWCGRSYREVRGRTPELM